MKKLGKLSFCRLFIVIGLVASIGLVVTSVMAQDNAEPEEFSTDEIVTEGDLGPDVEFEESFGQNGQATWITAFDFTPHRSEDTYRDTTNGYRYLTAGVAMTAGIRLPSGALLVTARLFYYDNDGARDPDMAIFRFPNPSGYQVLCNLSPPGGTPGYTNSAAGCGNLNHTIENGQTTYMVEVRLNGTSGEDLAFKGVRLFWRRQIRTGLSHPFTDIGHLPAEFRDSIAALRASGITTGTTPTTYSPSQPLTRAQMAVFLARALGLYWVYPSY